MFGEYLRTFIFFIVLGFTASSASLSSRALNSFASDDCQLSSASMSRDSGRISVSSLRRKYLIDYFSQMVSKCEDQGGHIRGVSTGRPGHVLIPDQEPFLHPLLQCQQLSV